MQQASEERCNKPHAPTHFALKNSGLNAFLYADVGTEGNGSTLTILSILARLGKDPWAEAARWAALPKAAVIDSLAKCIAEMQLAPSALASARDSATRLVQLLPTNSQRVQLGNAARSATARATATDTPKMVSITVLYVAFAAWMALNVLLVSNPSSGVLAPISQSSATSETTNPTTKSPPTGAAVAEPPMAPAGD